MEDPPVSKPIDRKGAATTRRYSVCTMVTNWPEYREMMESFQKYGFVNPETEFLHVDNTSQNSMDAFESYNLFLSQAEGQIIILCHQDVLLINDGRPQLDRLIGELEAMDPDWGLCGNAGAKCDGSLALRITDPNSGEVSRGGPFPTPVVGLDENFLVVRRNANLALSHDLRGFHFYGADLCIVADILGLKAYVIDFHLVHKSPGKLDRSYWELRRAVRAKYRRAFRPRWVHVTTLFPIFIGGSATLSFVARALHRAGASKLARRLRRGGSLVRHR